MAYNPYNYGNQYANPYQPQFSQNIYAYVNGLEGAKAYQVLANQNVLLIDSDNPVIYMKSGNAMGQANIQCFKIQQIQENEIKQSNNTSNNNYVTKSDLNSLIKRIKVLEDANKREKVEVVEVE